MEASSSSAPVPRPPPTPMFDVSLANALAADEDWTGLEKYITKLVADITGLDAEHVALVHPDLFIIPRNEEMLKKMDKEQYDDATDYFNKSIESLKEGEADYRPLDLDMRIEDMAKLLQKRSLPKKRYSIEDVQTAISDYFHLYFSQAISPGREGIAENSLWQFAMKIIQAPQNVARGKRGGSRPGYRCLACQWTVQADQQSITSMRYHFAHSNDRKSCMRVTQRIVDRLNAMMGANGVVPDVVELIRRRNKCRETFATSERGMNANSIFQKVKAAHDISQAVLNLLGSDASVQIDHATLVAKVLEQEGILLELKHEILTAEPEASSVPYDETNDPYNNLIINLPDFNEIPIPEQEKWL